MASVLNKLGLSMSLYTKHLKFSEQSVAMDIHHFFLLPYLPLLNPMEVWWSKIKSELRDTPFGNNEMIADRIEKAVKKVKPEDCQGWIHHSRRLFTKCVNVERV